MKKRCIALLFMAGLSLSAQQWDSRVREYLSPVRIVWQQDAGLIETPENLLLPGKGQSDLANTYLCIMRSVGTACPALLLDFEKEI